MLENIKAVLFDLDGTLVDSMWVWKDIDIEYLGKYGNYVLIRTHRDPKEVAAKLREEKILIKIYHNQLLKGWVRITTGSSEVMRKFWDAFIKIETE